MIEMDARTSHIAHSYVTSADVFYSSAFYIFASFRRAKHISFYVIKVLILILLPKMQLFIGKWSKCVALFVVTEPACEWIYIKSISNHSFFLSLYLFALLLFHCCFAFVPLLTTWKKEWKTRIKTAKMINCWKWQLIAIEFFSFHFVTIIARDHSKSV